MPLTFNDKALTAAARLLSFMGLPLRSRMS
jgi:hypothetical protein